MADTHVGDSALPSLTSMCTVVWGMLHIFVGLRPFYIGGPPIVPKKEIGNIGVICDLQLISRCALQRSTPEAHGVSKVPGVLWAPRSADQIGEITLLRRL